MKWPTKSKAIPRSRTPFFNLLYLSAAGNGGPDPTIVWTSEVPWEPVEKFVKEFNHESSRLIGSSHLLVQAVGQALKQHPEINRRVIGRRVYEFHDCNVCLAARVSNSNEVNVIQFKNADQKSLYQIAHIIWKKQLDFMRDASAESRDLKRMRKMPGWLMRTAIRYWNFLDRWFRVPIWGRIDRLRESVVLINDFSHPRFPNMRGYKPSRQPGESKPLSVTLGRPEEKVELANGEAVVRKVAPITVRVDHRICDGYELGQFTSSLIELMRSPRQLQNSVAASTANENPNATDPIEYRKSA